MNLYEYGGVGVCGGWEDFVGVPSAGCGRGIEDDGMIRTFMVPSQCVSIALASYPDAQIENLSQAPGEAPHRVHGPGTGR